MTGRTCALGNICIDKDNVLFLLIQTEEHRSISRNNL